MVRNFEAISIFKRVHQVTSNSIRNIELEDNYLNERNLFKKILYATYADRLTFYTTYKLFQDS